MGSPMALGANHQGLKTGDSGRLVDLSREAPRRIDPLGLLEVSTGVYVGHVPARVRERLWLRILEDVGKGRALMIYSTRREQRFSIRVHNHSWEPVDMDGLTVMRRVTVESRAIAKRSDERRRLREGKHVTDTPTGGKCQGDGLPGDGDLRRRNWSKAARRRRFQNEVERRHDET